MLMMIIVMAQIIKSLRRLKKRENQMRVVKLALPLTVWILIAIGLRIVNNQRADVNELRQIWVMCLPIFFPTPSRRNVLGRVTG